MLRKIQRIAAITAAIFGIGALFDVVASVAGFAPAPETIPLLFSGLPMIDRAPTLPGWLMVFIALGLTIAPFVAIMTVSRGSQAAHDNARSRLDGCRRVTWGTSIVETTGCLMLMLNGSIFFVPSAVALLIVGVAELASILYDVEHGTTIIVSERALHRHQHL